MFENGSRRWLGYAGLGALIVTVVLLREPASAAVLALAEWVRGLGWLAPVVFTAAFAVAIPLIVPAAPFLLIGGVLFGPVMGVVYGFLGNVVGGIIAFALARGLLRSRVERWLASAAGFEVMTKALRREGLRGVGMLRLSPVLPAWLINYALGFSRVTWSDYLLSSLAVIPSTMLYALSGAGLGDLAALEGGAQPQQGITYYVLISVGIAATIIVSVMLGRRARKLLNESDQDDE